MATVPASARLEGDALLEGLWRLLGEGGPPEGLAEALAATASGDALRGLLLPCLAREPVRLPTGKPLAAELLGPPSEPTFTEIQALTIIVRLLGTETGDLSGDTVALPAAPADADARALAAAAGGAGLALRGEALMLAVLELLRGRAREFERGEEPFLRLEALRALRLQLLPLPLGAGRHWWVEESVGHCTHGETRRLLVDTLSRTLGCVGDELCHRPKTAVLGCLWSLVAASPDCRNHFLLGGGAGLAAGALRAQARLPPPPVEATLITACGFLAALVKGPRANARRLAELRPEADALELLRRCRLHRPVVAAAFFLLGSLACDEAVATRISALPEAMDIIAAARTRWPKDAEEALQTALRKAPQPAHDSALALLSGAPDAVERSKAAKLRGLNKLPPV